MVRPPFKWSVCGNQIKYHSNRPNLPRDTYPELIKYMRVLIYNGDWDACVPQTDGARWTSGMGYGVAKDWHPWFYAPSDNSTAGLQVGGYAVLYETLTNFSFVTVRGGRHEVPETAPEQAFALLGRVLAGENF